MKKIILFTFVLLLFAYPLEGQAFGLYNPFNGISRVISDMDLQNRSTISISVKNLDNSSKLYSKNEDKLLNPASVMKVLTFAPILSTLGSDYNFSTAIYSDANNNLYIKLGADPLLKNTDLDTLAAELKNKLGNKAINKIYIDDTIIDKTPYLDGWTSDDFYPNGPMISPYTLNQNQTVVKILVSPDRKNVEISQPKTYKHTIINQLGVGLENSITIRKNNEDDNRIINLEGTVVNDTELAIPVSNPKYNLIVGLNEALAKAKIDYNKEFFFAKMPANLKKIAEVRHSIDEIATSLLKDSDNFSAEVAFRVAGAKYSGKTPGTTKDGIKMFYDYYNANGFDTKDVKIVDASGTSRYDLVSVNWVSNALIQLFKETDIRKYMAQPGEGTLSKRLRHFKGQLWAKTGTLSDLSALCGVIKRKNGKDAVFAIIISNFNKKSSVIKAFEDDLVSEIWKF